MTDSHESRSTKETEKFSSELSFSTFASEKVSLCNLPYTVQLKGGVYKTILFVAERIVTVPGQNPWDTARFRYFTEAEWAECLKPFFSEQGRVITDVKRSKVRSEEGGEDNPAILVVQSVKRSWFMVK